MDDIDLLKCNHEHHNIIIDNYNNIYNRIVNGQDLQAKGSDLSGDLNKIRDKIWMLSKKQKKDLVNGYLKAMDPEKKITILYLILTIIKLLDEAKCYKISELELYHKRFQFKLYENNAFKGLSGSLYIYICIKK